MAMEMAMEKRIVSDKASHKGLTGAQYHAEDKSLSNGRKDSFDSDPLLYYQYYVEKSRPVPGPSKALTTGLILHLMILEPDKAATDVLILPEKVLGASGNRGTKSCAEFMEDNPAEFYVTPKEMGPLSCMVESVNKNSEAMAIIGQCDKMEYDIFWQGADGIDRKALCDLLSVENGVVSNLKTSRHPLDFEKSVEEFKYHRGAAWYLDAALALTGESFIHPFIVVGNQPPYYCKVWDLPPEAIVMGRCENKAIMERYRRCLESGQWGPTQDDERGTVDLTNTFYERRLRYVERIGQDPLEAVSTRRD